MALTAFIISGFLGLIAAVASTMTLGFGLLAAFGIYLLISTTLPVIIMLSMIDRTPGTEGGVLVNVQA